MPEWLKKRVPFGTGATEKVLAELSLNTVCVNARCPNRGECFSKGEATFMILGNICTRDCRFCAVQKGTPFAVDISEAERIVSAVEGMGLKYVVITSVTRDDLGDGGAAQFIEVTRKLRDKFNGNVGIELLISDLGGNWEALRLISREDIAVLNHNLETVERLYPAVRPQANYQKSLELLKIAKEEKPKLLTKSGLMVGLGETKEEVARTMGDLQKVFCDFLTIGQYLQPGPEQLEVTEFIPPENFEEYRQEAIRMGFRSVASGPFVRSSYNANQMIKTMSKNEIATD